MWDMSYLDYKIMFETIIFETSVVNFLYWKQSAADFYNGFKNKNSHMRKFDFYLNLKQEVGGNLGASILKLQDV